jgi:peptidoglycan/xylan/chitin deacetylase (PgdA/CDA1 family)
MDDTTLVEKHPKAADAVAKTIKSPAKMLLQPASDNATFSQGPLAGVLPLCVFNFHHVEDELSKPSRKHITISSAGLRQFMRKVRALGFEPISLKALYHNPNTYQTLSNRRYCLITFDDGLVNNFDCALPVINAEQCPVTIFALPGRYGGTNEWDEGHLPEAERDQLMTREQMQEMAASPYVTFGSHGLYHTHLPNVSRETIRQELHESHQSLSTLLGSDYVPVMAYPWGEYSQTVLEEMAESPYDYGFTVENGSANASHNPYLLPRYTVFWRDGNPLMLHAKLYRHGLIHWWGALKHTA